MRWFSLRGLRFVGQRGGALVRRYGLTPAKAQARIRANVGMLAQYGCRPTFPTPGRVVERYPEFIREVQAAGAEIAVHSYHHVDLRGYQPAEAAQQLTRAADIFTRHGIEYHGFRCPYLSCAEELIDVLPKGTFGYSSNAAIWWNPRIGAEESAPDTLYVTIRRFYRPRSSAEAVSVPYFRDGVVEIPVTVPDDLLLHDGLHLSIEAVALAWCDLLEQIYERGEHFNLLYHPELAALCEIPLRELLVAAKTKRPGIWVATLSEINEWWREKAAFSAKAAPVPEGWRIEFECSERATMLAKGLDAPAGSSAWAAPYRRLPRRALTVAGTALPFLGLWQGASPQVVSFLKGQGYIVEMGPDGPRCAVYLDEPALAGLQNEQALVKHIEDSPGPLVRYWRWPDGARSVLSISGDLDALSLLDYADRLTSP